MKKKIRNIVFFVFLGFLAFLLYRVQQDNEILKTQIENIKEDETNYMTALQKLKVTASKKRKNYHSYWDTIYKVGDKFTDIYSLSYEENDLKKGSILSYKKDASKELAVLLKASYPYVFGDHTKEEQYDSLQLAIWNLAYRTGESKTKKTFEKMVEELGKDRINDTVLTRAKNYIKLAENMNIDEIKIKPKLEFKATEKKWKLKNQKRIVGPFEYHTECMENKIIDVVVIGENGNKIFFTAVDENGNAIEDLTNQKTFYISVDENYIDFDVEFKVEYQYLRAAIYESQKGKNYLVRTYTRDKAKKAIDVHIKTNDEDEEEGETKTETIEV